ncbi:helicase-associated domain-containing protein [Metallococcus carri]|uniref:helicase-associated domain-containing protein n=1 Tax=Metallococcus carri TaxID=1656884 RepID=UPI002E28C1E0|nr:helicase-associated domain-containing protein [Metallococcus carri]
MPARSFADDIRARSADQLTRLIVLRPDVAHPAPADVTALAARAATRGSTARALEALPADRLRVLEALLVSPTDAAALLGGADIADVVEDLWDRALVWDSPDGRVPSRAVGEILPFPASLGPDLPAPADLAERYAALPDEARRLLDRLAWQHPRATVEGVVAEGIPALVDAELVVREDDNTVVVPRAVALHVRGGVLYADGLTPPEPAGQIVQQVDATAGMAATELLWQVESVAQLWAEDPPRVLRSGGLSVRDHRRTASALGLDTEHVAFVLEIASAAGLFADDRQAEPSFLPTRGFDDWLEASRGERWRQLADAWWRTVRAPSLAGSRTEAGTVVNVLGPEASWPLMRTRRHDVLTVLGRLPVDFAPSVGSLDALLHWSRPLRLPPGAPTHTGVVLREASWLGLVAHGALSSAGRAIVAGDDVDLDELLPATVDRMMVQADLTAVVPGPPDDSLHRLLQCSAEVESRGGATVYRFDEDSVRRALDSGIDAAELRERLTAASLTPLPQPLTYLIDDVARRHGRLRVGAAGSYLRCDDPALVATLLADPSLGALGLRSLAPGVLVSRMPAATLLDLLARAGHSALAETSDGGVLVTTRQDSARAPNPAPPAPVVTRSTDSAAASALVERLMSAQQRSAEAARPGEPRIPHTEPSDTLSILQEAAADRMPVWIGFVDASGDLKRALFHPERVDGGRTTGLVGDTRRSFSVHRITGVVPA